MAPIFSVVIPTYNQADYLKVALQSVLDQTLRDFEVVVVNNYSADHTLEAIGEFNDPRVQVINYRNHGIIAAARNVGIKAAVGEYVSFLDSDDTWYPNKLQKVAEAIETDPQVGLVCHDQDLVQEGRVARQTHYGPTPEFQDDMWGHVLFICNGPSTSATTVARSCLNEVGCFSENPVFVTAEDYDLWIRLAKVCRFRFLPDVLGTHHYHAASASSNVELHIGAALAVLNKHCRELKDSDRSYPMRVVRHRYANVYYGGGRQHQRRGAIKKPLGYYARALMTYPLHRRAYGGLAILLADMLLGHQRRRTVVNSLWRPSWRWG